MPEGGEYEQMMWLLKRFSDNQEAAEREARFQATESAFKAPDPVPAAAPARLPPPGPHAAAIWRRGARLDQRDSDFDLDEYRPQTWALVRDAVAIERLRVDLPSTASTAVT